jgi:predicted transposase/invertase (TIGR01784 family)
LNIHKRPLISFLNAILKQHPHIVDVELIDTEMQLAGPKGNAIRLVVLAKLKNGDKISIEMQRRNRGDTIDRAMHYLAAIMTRDNGELLIILNKTMINSITLIPK